MQEPTFTELFPRVVMSILFKYYWHAKQLGDTALQKPEKEFYHHTCDSSQKLAAALEQARSLCPGLFTIRQHGGEITISSPNFRRFIVFVEDYVRWVAAQDDLKPNPQDLKSREQIRIVPFKEQAAKIFKLLQYLVKEEFKKTKIILRELDLNNFGFGDYEKFCQEEVLIWLHLQGRLEVKHYLGSKDRHVNGKSQYIWLVDAEFQNQLRYGSFLLDYNNETIKFESHDPLSYATTEHEPHAWGIVFKMLIEAQGQRVTSATIERELRSHDIELTVTRAVLELRRKFRSKNIPAGYFPTGSPGRGSTGYYLRDSLPVHPSRLI